MIHQKSLFKARPYQEEAIKAIRQQLLKGENPLVVGSTGIGKSVILRLTIDSLASQYPEFRCIIVVNKVTLVRQFRDKYFPNASIYCGTENSKCLENSVVIATIQSIANVRVLFHLIILDEAHNLGGDLYDTFLHNCRQERPQVKVLGTTATPFNNQGYIYGKNKLFRSISFKRDLDWSIENGFLVPPTIKHSLECFDTSDLTIRLGDFVQREVDALTMDIDKVKRQVTEALAKLRGRQKVIWSCASIAHAQVIKELLATAGEQVSIVHSQLSKHEQKQELDAFDLGSSRHLVFITIVSEGYDQPSIDAVVLLRPMKSARLMIQTVGRGLRTFEGKTDCLVLDFGEVFLNCGTLNNPIITTGNKRPEKSTVKFCPECLEIISIEIKVCKCGHCFKPETRDMTANTTTMASTTAPLSAVEEILLVTRVSFDTYKAKSGRSCARILYKTSNLLGERIIEYFTEGQEWQASKFKARLNVLSKKREIKSEVESEKISYRFSDMNQSFDFSASEGLKIKTKRSGKYTNVTGVFYGD